MQARRAEAEKAIPPEAKAPQEPDALVLTPALRVHEGGRTRPESTDAALEAVNPDAVEAAPEPEAVEAAPEGLYHDAEAVEEAPYEEAVDEAEDVLVALDAVVDAAEERADLDPVDELPEAPAEPETLEAKIAALEALISGSNDSVRQAPAEPEPVEEEQARTTAPAEELSAPAPVEEDLAAEAVEDDLGEDTAEEAIAWEDHLDAPEDSAEADQPQEAEDPLAMPEPVEIEPGQPAEPEPEESRASDPFVFVSRHSTPGPEAQPVEEAAAKETRVSDDEDSAATLLADGAPAALIDEEALRDMVVEIVREELQGALGERITRNVRRLVRREIHRALASQELD